MLSVSNIFVDVAFQRQRRILRSSLSLFIVVVLGMVVDMSASYSQILFQCRGLQTQSRKSIILQSVNALSLEGLSRTNTPCLMSYEINRIYRSKSHQLRNSFDTRVRFWRKRTISTSMTTMPTSFTNYSLTEECRTSVVDICMVTPGEYNVRALADLCCRSFYGEHYWWSSLLNPISAIQRVILFEKVLADLSNRIFKHRVEGCGSLHLAIERSTGEAVGNLLSTHC